MTGTNGKTTITTFLTQALQNANICTISAGNVGSPLSSYSIAKSNKDNAIAVCEVSSFQSEKIEIFNPKHTIWANFAADHLEKHLSLENYFDCKANLLTHTKDNRNIFVGKSVNEYVKIFKKNIKFNCINKEQINILEPFAHNNISKENYSLIESLWGNFNLSKTILTSTAATFKLPKYRLDEAQTITQNDKTLFFWNDSKATNFHSMSAALNTFDKKVILICGGKSKNENLDKYLKIFDQKTKMLFLLGETGEELNNKLQKDSKMRLKFYHFFGKEKNNCKNIIKTLTDAVFLLAQHGDVVLLSPGFSSLDMFIDYKERGEFFEKMFYI